MYTQIGKKSTVQILQRNGRLYNQVQNRKRSAGGTDAVQNSDARHTRQIPFHAPWPKLRTTQLQPPSPALTHYVLHFCQMPNRNTRSSAHCWKELLHFSFIQSASIIQKKCKINSLQVPTTYHRDE